MRAKSWPKTNLVIGRSILSRGSVATMLVVSRLVGVGLKCQVRSILDHAWSEIEHEAVYKSGVLFPADVRRRFKAVAASLEVLEDAFVALAAEHDKLIIRYRGEYLAGTSMEQRFDVARLEAFLEIEFPSGVGWRAAAKAGNPFPHGSANTAIEALDAANLVTGRRLAAILAGESFSKCSVRIRRDRTNRA